MHDSALSEQHRSKRLNPTIFITKHKINQHPCEIRKLNIEPVITLKDQTYMQKMQQTNKKTLHMKSIRPTKQSILQEKIE